MRQVHNQEWHVRLIYPVILGVLFCIVPALLHFGGTKIPGDLGDADSICMCLSMDFSG